MIVKNLSILTIGLLASWGCDRSKVQTVAPATTASSPTTTRSAPSATLPSRITVQSSMNGLTPRAPAEYEKIVDDCMGYAPLRDQIVFTQDAYEGDDLRLNPPNPNYVIPDGGGTCAYIPPEWTLLNPQPRASGIGRVQSYGSLLFMHGRETPNGQKLLSVVTWPHYSGKYGLRLLLIELDRRDEQQRREVISFVVPRSALLGIDDPQPGLGIIQRIRFFAGQADRADPSKWTIQYTVSPNGSAKAMPGLIEMKLTGDPELANLEYLWPKSGNIPVAITVQRPDGSMWHN